MKNIIKFNNYYYQQKDIDKVRIKLDKYRDKQLHQIFLEFLRDWRNFTSVCKALKTLQFIETNFPYSEYILKCYSELREMENIINKGNYYKPELNTQYK